MTGYIVHADSEELAEGYAWDFLERLAPLLERLGVPPLTVDQVFANDADQTLTVNGTTYLLRTMAEQHLDIDLWQLATRRVFGIVNTLLIAAACEERIFQLYTGGDTCAVLLSPAQYAAVLADREVSGDAMPQPVPPWPPMLP